MAWMIYFTSIRHTTDLFLHSPTLGRRAVSMTRGLRMLSTDYLAVDFLPVLQCSCIPPTTTRCNNRRNCRVQDRLLPGRRRRRSEKSLPSLPFPVSRDHRDFPSSPLSRWCRFDHHDQCPRYSLSDSRGSRPCRPFRRFQAGREIQHRPLVLHPHVPPAPASLLHAAPAAGVLRAHRRPAKTCDLHARLKAAERWRLA